MVLDTLSHVLAPRVSTRSVTASILGIATLSAINSWSKGYVCEEDRNVHNKTFILVVGFGAIKRCLTGSSCLAAGMLFWRRAGAVPLAGGPWCAGHCTPSRSQLAANPAAAALAALVDRQRATVCRGMQHTQRCKLEKFRQTMGEGWQKRNGPRSRGANRRYRLL